MVATQRSCSTLFESEVVRCLVKLRRGYRLFTGRQCFLQSMYVGGCMSVVSTACDVGESKENSENRGRLTRRGWRGFAKCLGKEIKSGSKIRGQVGTPAAPAG